MTTAFTAERNRLHAGADLSAECFDEFQRLSKRLSIAANGHFGALIFVRCESDLLRDQLIGQFKSALPQVAQPTIAPPTSATAFQFAEFEGTLREAVALARNDGPNEGVALHLVGFQQNLNALAWQAANLWRERLADIPAALLFWLPVSAIEDAAKNAPDVWSWRDGVYDFCVTPNRESVDTAATPSFSSYDLRSMSQQNKRISEIRTLLPREMADALRLPLLDELARLLFSQGKLEEALEIRQKEELPVYEKLGDVRSRAVTLGKIADIYVARGRLDEALEIRQKEQLPAFEKLGDVRERAVTLANIALNRLAKGEPPGAVHALLLDALAAFEGMGLPEARQVEDILRSYDLAVPARS